jgi:hypothetical protein
MKTYGGSEYIYIHLFLTSALDGGEWSASRPGRFTPGERAPGTHWIGSWIGPRTGLDNVERRKILPLPGLEPQPLDHPSRSQSIHRLRYPGSTSGSTVQSLPNADKEMPCTYVTRRFITVITKLHLRTLLNTDVCRAHYNMWRTGLRSWSSCNMSLEIWTKISQLTFYHWLRVIIRATTALRTALGSSFKS